MRAKVKVSDASDTIVMAGAAGPKAGRALQEVFSDFPKQPNEVSRQPGIGTVINLQDGRFLLALAPPSAVVLRQRLANFLVPVKAGAWRWLDIRNGVPLVSAATQDQLVPQMANFELPGGGSLPKGWFTPPGIGARLQHHRQVQRPTSIPHLSRPVD